VARKSPLADGRPAVFRYEARLDGRTIVVLQGVEAASGGLDVETEAYPVGQKPDDPPLQRTFTFATHETGRRFTDDVLTALEYQNCLINEHS
jgi:hypothetical protein